MELKNYLVGLLSNIIHDRLQLLADVNNDMKKADLYKKTEELFSDVNNVLNIKDEDLKEVLADITDSETIDAIIENISMIKIVLNGKNEGLDLDLDDSQLDLLHGVYEIVNSYRTELENKNSETKKYLEDFIAKCERLSSEIGTGVVRDVDSLDEILNESDITKEDIVKSKFEILRNNSKNFNMNVDTKVKEEVDLRILLKNINVDFDNYSLIEKNILLSHTNKENSQKLIDYIGENDLQFSSFNLFLLLLFSNTPIIENVVEFSKNYSINLDDLFKMPGIFISKSSIDKINNILDEYKDNEDYYIIENLKYIGAFYENFVDNISLLESNNRDVSDCFKNNMLSLIIPDMKKNINILFDISLTDKEFSAVVINPFLATSKSSFKECGLGEYLDSNPLRLCTSYYRLRQISANIVDARKNGRIIFRSLSDKKSYWLAKSITHDSNSEVI